MVPATDRAPPRPYAAWMRALAAVTVALALLTVACGGGSDTEVRSSGDTTSTSTSSASTTTATGACTAAGGTDAQQTPAPPSPPALLTDVRTGRQPCADRIVFQFNGATPGYTVSYQAGPFTTGESGEPITIAGSAFLVLRFEPASGVDLNQPSAPPTYTGPTTITPSGLTHVKEVRRLSDFEAVMTWVVGLDATRPFTVATLGSPTRVYVDIG